MLLLVLLLVFLPSMSPNNGKRPVYTLVTFFDDLETDSKIIGLSKAQKMLKEDENLIIFGPAALEYQIMERRKQHNTLFIPKQLKTIQTSWYHQSPKQQQNLNSSVLKQNSVFDAAKVFLMSEASQKDKFNSDYFIWVDASSLYQDSSVLEHPQSLIRSFYQWIQPQWIIFTKQRQEQAYLKSSQGQQRYINRRFMFHQIAVPTFMGGYKEIVTDIKNAYQSLLRILVQNKEEAEISLSLMSLRFPYLVPNTVSISLTDINQKIHLYERTNRQPQRKSRFFNAILESQDKITVKQDKTITQYSFKFEPNEPSNKQVKTLAPHEYIDSVKAVTAENERLRIELSNFIVNKQSFKTKVIIIETFFLLMLGALYVRLILQNIKSKKKILQSDKKNEACYIKISRHSNQIPSS